MDAKFNYLVLLLIIIVGVTTGNLLSNWIAGKFTTTETNKIVVEESEPEIEVPELETEKLSNPPEDASTTNQQDATAPEPQNTNKLTQSELIDQRRLDKDGIRLGKTCEEWRQADKDMDTPTSNRGVDKHCGDYELYLETGVLTPRF